MRSPWDERFSERHSEAARSRSLTERGARANAVSGTLSEAIAASVVVPLI
ncbi:MAG: hypothetical protein PUK70_08970 [Bacteroidales bacterium]|nr:hypothetical protein [Bacteroidales bacterium]MDY6002135.1 hypothetical protein [Candidatus Cryptobacteroides sp.]